ncbi:unnamed protein product, partial [Brenthis ino]
MSERVYGARAHSRTQRRALLGGLQFVAAPRASTQLHCTPTPCVRKKRTHEECGGRGILRLRAPPATNSEQSPPDARRSIPPPQGAP